MFSLTVLYLYYHKGLRTNVARANGTNENSSFVNNISNNNTNKEGWDENVAVTLNHTCMYIEGGLVASLHEAG